MNATCGPVPLPGAPAGGWHRRVWVLAAPIMLPNMATPLSGTEGWEPLSSPAAGA